MGTFSMIPLSCFISLIFACVNCVYILYANLHVWKVSTLYVEAIGYQMESPHLFCTAFIEAEYLKWTPNSHVQTSLDSQLTLGAPSPPSKAGYLRATMLTWWFAWALEFRNLAFTLGCQVLCELSHPPSACFDKCFQLYLHSSMKEDTTFAMENPKVID